MRSLNGAGAPGSQERTKNTGTARDQMLSSGRDLSTQKYRTEQAQMTRISALSGDGTMLFESPLYVNLQSLFRSLAEGMGHVTREHLRAAWRLELREELCGTGAGTVCIRNRNRMSG